MIGKKTSALVFWHMNEWNASLYQLLYSNYSCLLQSWPKRMDVERCFRKIRMTERWSTTSLPCFKKFSLCLFRAWVLLSLVIKSFGFGGTSLQHVPRLHLGTLHRSPISSPSRGWSLDRLASSLYERIPTYWSFAK